MTDIEFQHAISSLAGGDKNALKTIYQDYVGVIYAIVYDKVKNKETAEDITSEFFIKLIRVAPSFKEGSPHKAWLITIARNMCIDYLRKNSREISSSDFISNNEDAQNEAEVMDSINYERRGYESVEDKVVLSEDMKKAMECLNDSEREVINLKLLGQYKFNEIAEMIGKPMGTVTWTYNQGIKKLRRCLSSYEG